MVEWKSPRRRNEEDDDDDDAREVVALKGVVAKLLIVNDDGTFFSCEKRAFTNVDLLPSSHHSHPKKLSF